MRKFTILIIVGLTAGAALFLGFLETKNIHSGPTAFLLLGSFVCIILVGIGVLGASAAMMKNPELRTFANISAIFFGLLGILIFFLPSLLPG
jgi:hypothetical protein